MSFDLAKGWFMEVNSQWNGAAMSLEVEEVLFDQKSPYQHVVVFKSKTFGHVLLIDGVIQFTERDEMAYQEMLSNIPLFSHPNPEDVLIVGGGDGGVLREVLKHDCVKSVIICEIDKVVIEAAKKYFPSTRAAWDNPKVTLMCGDAVEYIKSDANKGKFDVIICDSSDPVGPAACLFERPFFVDMEKALKAGGRIATQGESMWNNVDLIETLMKGVAPLFESVEYATTQIPTYPCGQIGFIVCAKAGQEKEKKKRARKAIARKLGCKLPVRQTTQVTGEFNYYTSELHSAAFVLPAFLVKRLPKVEEEEKEVPVAKKLKAKGHKHATEEPASNGAEIANGDL